VRSATAVLLAVVIAQVSISALQQGLPVLGPVLQQAFDLDTTGTGVLLGVGSLGTAAAVLVWGRLADHTTDRLISLLGLILTSVSLAVAGLMALIDSFLGLALGLLAAGIFAAAPTVALTKSIVQAFESTQRMGLAFGVRQAAVPFGAAIAGVVLPLLALRWSLSVALWAIAVVLLAAAVGVARAVHAEQRRHLRPPLLPTPWLRIAPMLTASCLYTATQIGIVSLLTLYLVNARGWSTTAAAAVFAGVMAVTIVLRVLVGLAADRWVHRSLWMFKATGILTATLLVLAAVTDPAPIAGFAIVAAGVCAMGWNALAFTLTVSLVPLERVGTSQGALIALIFAAWGISPMATGYLVQTYSWSVAWLVLATLAVLGAAIATTRGFARRPSNLQQYR